MTPIQTLYTYLQNVELEYEPGKFWNGIGAEWTAPDGSTQPAPVVQMRELDEAAKINGEPLDNKRILLIKTVGSGGGTRYVSSPVFVFAIMGKVIESPAFPEAYAELLYAALLKFTHADCIVSIDPLGRIGGSYKMPSGRSAYDMEFEVKVDSGLMG